MMPHALPETPPKPAPRAAPNPANILAPALVPDISLAVTCDTCQSDEHLVYERVTLVPARGLVPAAWDVECWCGRCEEFHGLRTAMPPSLPYGTLEHGFNVDA